MSTYTYVRNITDGSTIFSSFLAGFELENIAAETGDIDDNQNEATESPEEDIGRPESGVDSELTNQVVDKKPNHMKVFWPLFILLISLVARRVVLSLTSDDLY